MKKIIGIILCLAAVLFIFGQIVPGKPETTTEKIQDWAVIGVLLAIGIPLSSAKKKTEDTNKK